jgi:hypothetical protein
VPFLAAPAGCFPTLNTTCPSFLHLPPAVRHAAGLTRQVAALLLNPLLEEPEHYWMVGRMVQVLVGLPPGPKGEVAALLASWRAQDMRV